MMHVTTTIPLILKTLKKDYSNLATKKWSSLTMLISLKNRKGTYEALMIVMRNFSWKYKHNKCKRMKIIHLI